ncbi:META domain-containing protein [Colwellia sp. C1TZA3]|uniref:META domain-containing protein n=1 Tax=Colwellia sp. C1TZA3 TaxID=2508879 RepID=UPI00174C866C|nr:META domain-containing protein [Colwellia sp. C1TZA3]
MLVTNQTKTPGTLADLTETYWKLVQLGGTSVVMTPERQSKRHFTLQTNDNRVTGFAGCNHFFGQFNAKVLAVGAGNLTFSALGVTQMVCPDIELNEQKVLQVLSNTTSYNITAKSLTLFSQTGAELASFDAVYF